MINNLHVKFESDRDKIVVCTMPTRQSMTDTWAHSPNHTQTATLQYLLKHCFGGINELSEDNNACQLGECKKKPKLKIFKSRSNF